MNYVLMCTAVLLCPALQCFSKKPKAAADVIVQFQLLSSNTDNNNVQVDLIITLKTAPLGNSMVDVL